MSNSVDQRIVQMQFDNAQFQQGVSSTLKSLQDLDKSLKLKDGVKGFKDIEKAAGSVDFSSMKESVENLNTRFGTLGEIGRNAIDRISSGLTELGQNVLRGATIQPMMDGLDEYSTKLGSIQTILTNTGWEDNGKGKSIEDVTKALDELNSYADQTIYNFSEMTRNIGTFTAAGVGLDQSVVAIKGIANLAASSGSTSEQASHAMYQLSQALSSGTVRLQDWVSVVNSGMGGKLFQDALQRTNEAMLKTQRASISAKEAIEASGSFRESLAEKWLTSDVLTETLTNFTRFTSDMDKEAQKTQEDQLRNLGYTAQQIETIKKESIQAYDAATKIKEFSQMVDVAKEALGSGWATTWELIIGDLQQARDLWTPIGNFVTGFIDDMSDARNNLLRAWSKNGTKDIDSGRDALVKGLLAVGEALIEMGKPISEAVNNVFGSINADGLIAISYAIRDLAYGFRDFVKESPVAQSALRGLGMIFTALLTVVKAVGIIIGGSFMVAITAVGLVFQTIGTIVDGVVTTILGFISTAIDGVGNVIGVFRDFGNTLTEQTGLKELGIFVVGIGRALDSLTKAIKGVGSWESFAQNLGLVGSRFGQLFDAVKPFIGEKIEQLLSFFNALKDGAIQIASGAIIGLAGAFILLGQALAPIIGTIVDFGSAVVNTFGESFNIDSLSENVTGVQDAISGLFSYLTSGEAINPSDIEKFGETIKTHVGAMFSDIGTIVTDLFGAFFSNGHILVDAVVGFLGQATSSISTAFDDLRSFITGLTGIDFLGIFDVFTPITDSISKFGTAFSDSLSKMINFDRMRDILDETKSKITNAFNSVTDFSDSIQMEKLGEKVRSAISSLYDSIKKSIDDFFSRIQTDLGENYQTPIEAVGSVFENLLGKLSGILDGLKAFASGLFDVDFDSADVPIVALFEKLKNDFGGAGSSPIDAVLGFFRDAMGKLSQFLGDLKGMASGLFGNVADFSGLFDFLQSILNLFQPGESEQAVENVKAVEKVADAVTEAKDRFSGITDFLKGGPAAIGEGLADFANGIFTGIEAFINKLDVGKIRQFVTILTSFAIDASVVASLFSFYKMLKSTTGVLDGVSGLLESISSRVKGTKTSNIADNIKAFAISVAVIVGAIVVLTYIDHQKMYEALPVLLGVAAVCVAIPILFAKLSKLESLDFSKFGAIAFGMIQMAASIAIIAGVLVLLSNFSNSITGGGLAMLAGIIGGFIGLSVIATKLDTKGISKLGKAMRNISMSLLLMWAAIELLGRMDPAVAAKGIIAIGAIMIFIGLMNKLASSGDSLGHSKNTFKNMGTTMLGVAAVIGVCAIVVGALGSLDLGTLAKGTIALAIMMALIGAFILAMTDLASIGNPSAMVAPLLALSVAIGVFAMAIGGLAIISAMGGDLVGATVSLAVALVILTAACVGIGMASKYLAAGAAGIIAITVGIAALTLVMIALSAVDFPTLLEGLKVFAVVVIAAAVALAIFGAIGKFLGPGLIALSTAFLIFGVALIAISAALLIGVAAMGLFTAMAPQFVPAFQQFAESLAKLFQTEDLVGTLIGFSIALTLLGAASLIAALGLGALGLVVNLFSGTFTKLAMDILNSIMLLSTGLSSMSGMIANGVQGLLSGITTGIANFAGSAMAQGQKIAGDIGNGLKTFDWAGAARTAISVLGGGLITGIQVLVTELPNLIGQIGGGIMEGIGNLLDEPLDAFGDWLHELTGVGQDREALKQQAKEQVEAIGEGSLEGAEASGEQAKEGYKQVGDKMAEGIQESGDVTKEALENLNSGLNEALPSGGAGVDTPAILNAMGLSPDIIGQGADAIKEKLGGIGVELPESLIQGISEGGADFDLLGGLTENLDPTQLNDLLGQIGVGGGESFVTGVDTGIPPAIIGELVTGKAKIDEGELSSKFSHAAQAAAAAFNTSLNSGIKPDLSGKINTAVNQVRQPAKFQQAGNSDGQAVTRGFKSGANGMGAAGKSAGKSAVDGVKSVDAYSSGHSVGSNIGQGLVDGLNAKKDDAYQAGWAVGHAGVQGEKDGSNTKSPSRIAIETGKFISKGLAIGIMSLKDTVYDAGYETGSTAVSSIMAMTSNLPSFFDDIDDNPTIRPVLDLTDYEAGIREMQGLNVGDQMVSAQWANRIGSGAGNQNGYYNNNQSSINITLDYKAGATPNQMVQEMANVLQVKNLMEA